MTAVVYRARTYLSLPLDLLLSGPLGTSQSGATSEAAAFILSGSSQTDYSLPAAATTPRNSAGRDPAFWRRRDHYEDASSVQEAQCSMQRCADAPDISLQTTLANYIREVNNKQHPNLNGLDPRLPRRRRRRRQPRAHEARRRRRRVPRRGRRGVEGVPVPR